MCSLYLLLYNDEQFDFIDSYCDSVFKIPSERETSLKSRATHCAFTRLHFLPKNLINSCVFFLNAGG